MGDGVIQQTLPPISSTQRLHRKILLIFLAWNSRAASLWPHVATPGQSQAGDYPVVHTRCPWHYSHGGPGSGAWETSQWAEHCHQGVDEDSWWWEAGLSGAELCGRSCERNREDSELGWILPTCHQVQSQIYVFTAAWRKLELHQHARFFSNRLYYLNIYK